MQIRLKLIDSRELEFSEQKIDEKTGKPIRIFQHILVPKDERTGFAVYSTFPLDLDKRLDRFRDYELLPKVNKLGHLVGWRFGDIDEKHLID